MFIAQSQNSVHLIIFQENLRLLYMINQIKNSD